MQAGHSSETQIDPYVWRAAADNIYSTLASCQAGSLERVITSRHNFFLFCFGSFWLVFFSADIRPCVLMLITAALDALQLVTLFRGIRVAGMDLSMEFICLKRGAFGNF